MSRRAPPASRRHENRAQTTTPTNPPAPLSTPDLTNHPPYQPAEPLVSTSQEELKQLKARVVGADTLAVGESLRFAGAPAACDRLEIFDRSSATRVSAIVESASDRLFVLRLEQATRVPEEASVRWFDGATAWQAIARLEHIDATRLRCQILPPHAWQPTLVRRSPRVPVDHSQLLVRIVSSVLVSGRRVQTTCLDASETGCRTTWPGQPPRVGDAVDLTWDVNGRTSGAIEVGWIAARVVRVIRQTSDSGAQQVCFDFETRGLTQAARIRAWHLAWLQRHRRNPRDETVA